MSQSTIDKMTTENLKEQNLSEDELIALVLSLKEEVAMERSRHERTRKKYESERASKAEMQRLKNNVKEELRLQREHNLNLKVLNKGLEASNTGFRNGDKMTSLRKQYQQELREKDAVIRNLRKEISALHKDIRTMRKRWEDVYDMVLKEKEQYAKACEKSVERMWKSLQEAEETIGKYRNQAKEAMQMKYKAETERDDANDKIVRLQRKIGMDHTNSGKPSSANEYGSGKGKGKDKDKGGKKDIANSRKKTGRKPGAQKHHPAAILEKYEGDDIVIIHLEADPEIRNSKKWYRTKKKVRKQIIGVEFRFVCYEYEADVWRERGSYRQYHAPFPYGVQNAVNYSPELKAFVMYLSDHCNVADEKISEMMKTLTGGKLQLSTGWINGLCHEFSKKSKKEQLAAYATIQGSPYTHIDSTVYRVNKHLGCITVNDCPDAVYFAYTDHKGHEAVKSTPVGQCNYAGVLIHDGEKTFLKYAPNHQQCWAHPLRYLEESIAFEPGRKWNRKMKELLRDTIHCRNSQNNVLSEEQQQKIRRKYDEITALGTGEYEYEPASQGYPEGELLLKWLINNRESMLYCLDKPWIPHTNNQAERSLRGCKRHTRAAVTNRAVRNAEAYCDFLTVIRTAERQGQNIFEVMVDVFSRPLELHKNSQKTKFKSKSQAEVCPAV